jgi:hypothetical protein
MPVGQGHDTAVGVGHETVWGTPVAPTAFVDHAGVSGGQVRPLIQGDTFRGRSPRTTFRGAKSDPLQIVSELQYEGFEDFFLHLFGDVDTTTVNAIKQHVFSFNDSIPMPVGLTVEVKYGAAASLRHEGMKMNQFTFDAVIDKIAKGTFDLVGEREASAGPAAASYSGSPLIIWTDITILKSFVAKECESAQFVISNNYNTDRRVLGSETVKEHTPGRRSITGTLTAFFEDLTTWHAVFDGDSSIGLQAKGTSIVQIPGSSPADFYDFILDLPTVEFGTHDKPIPDAGPLRQTLAWEAKRTTGNEMGTLTITNARLTVP